MVRFLIICILLLTLSILSCSTSNSPITMDKESLKQYQNRIKIISQNLVNTQLPKNNVIALKQLLSLAVQNNYGMNVLRDRLKSKEYQIKQDSKFFQSNPKLMLSPKKRFKNPSTKSLDYSLELMQEFELSGQSNIREEIALLTKEQVKSTLISYQIALKNRVKTMFYELLTLQNEIVLIDEMVDFSNKLLSIARQKLKSGTITPLDLNTSIIEYNVLLNERKITESDILQKLNSLKMLCGIPFEYKLQIQGRLVQHNYQLDFEKLFVKALKNRSEIASRYSDIRITEAKISLSKSERFPSMEIGLNYSKEDEEHLVGFSVAFSIPVLNSKSYEINAYEKELESYQNEILELLKIIQTDIYNNIIKVRLAQSSMTHYKEKILPILEENHSLIKKSFRLGQINFFMYIQHQKQFIEAQKQFISYITDYYRAIGDLETSIGSEME